MSKLTSRTPEEERDVSMTHAQCTLGGAPELTFPFTLVHLNVANLSSRLPERND